MSEMICIKSFRDKPEAEIVKNLLISNGIAADVFYSGLGSYYGFEIGASARLMVAKEDQERALALIHEEVSKSQVPIGKSVPFWVTAVTILAAIALTFVIDIWGILAAGIIPALYFKKRDYPKLLS